MPRHCGALGAAVVIAALVTLTSCSSPSSPPPDTAVGTVADSGFRPGANGFSFENYGVWLSNGREPVNLTAGDVERMFGPGVCVYTNSDGCQLTPEAQAWVDETNTDMGGGHCYGFSVLANLIWRKQVNVKTLGASATTGLQIDGNKVLQRQLAYDWALQLLPSVQSKQISGTPNQVLNQLRKVLTPDAADTYTLVFWKPDFTGGHAVTPYEVQSEGNGQYKVLIYDNNWPGTTRAILFDTKADTWSYYASVNPDEPDAKYEGNAKTKTIALSPTSPGLGTQPCPFCTTVPTTGASQGGTEEIYLAGSDTNHANLLVTDSAGHRLGYVNGTFVNQIPGARVDQLISNPDWTDSIEPDFFVPANSTYTITIDGSALRSPDTEAVGVIGPSYDLSVTDIVMRPGDKDTLVATPDATRISYTSSRAEAPVLELGVSDKSEDYSFAISGVSDKAGRTIALGLPAEGKTLTLDNGASSEKSSVSFKITRFTKRGAQVFDHNDVVLTSGTMVALDFGDWTSVDEGMSMTSTRGGSRSTQTLANQGGR